MRLRRIIGGVCIAVLLVGGAVAANAVSDNGVTATFSPGSPNGSNDFYTSPVDITFEGSSGDTCQPASRTYSGPNGTSVSVDSTCTPSDPAGTPYTGTFTFKYDDRAPTVADHADIVRDAGNQSQIDVNYTEPSANDDVDGSPTVTCNPPSGSSFQVGRTTVTCTARDNAGNTSAPSRFVITVDGAPTIRVPGNLTAEATSPAGAFVNYLVTAEDGEDGNLTSQVSCQNGRRDGDTFPLGETTVSCAVSDSANNSASDSFKVTVQDTTPPTFDPLPAPEREGNVFNGFQAPPSDSGAYTKPTATDIIDGGVLNVDCGPKAPGEFFPLGSTSIRCTATDQRGNQSGPVTFPVRVTDTTSPNFVVQPQDVVVQAASVNTGTPASNSCIQRFLNSPTAFDVVEGSVPVTNNGRAQFPMGQTTVTFTATDTRNPPTPGTAVVTIRRGPQGPCTIDARAPGNVTNLQIREGNNLVVLTWRNPLAADFSHVEVYRQRASLSGLGVLVCRTRRPRCVDRNVRNGIQYRYAVFSVDEAGNYSRGRSGFARPHRILLLRPRDGARISRPPVVDWVSIRGADYYNLQLYRVVRGPDRKVLSRWPQRSRYALSWRWRQDRRVRRFVPGQYYWYVWPGFGSVRAGNYGRAMGPSDFRVVRRR